MAKSDRLHQDEIAPRLDFMSHDDADAVGQKQIRADVRSGMNLCAAGADYVGLYPQRNGA